MRADRLKVFERAILECLATEMPPVLTLCLDPPKTGGWTRPPKPQIVGGKYTLALNINHASQERPI